MRHRYFGRKLSRTKNERRRLFAGLVRDLIIRDRITTSVAKAKAVQPIIEKLITKARKGTEAARRQMIAMLPDTSVIKTLTEEAKTRFSGRSSGFTRITKLGKRLGDSTDIAILSFVDERVKAEVVKSVSPADAPKPSKSATSPKVPKKAKKV